MGKRGRFILIINLIIIFVIFVLACNSIKSSAETNNKYNQSQYIDKLCIVLKSDTNIKSKQLNKKINPPNSTQRQLSESNKYLLAKIAMAEAENQNIKTKALIIMSILNRVESSNFPDSISDVIFESKGNIYQYSPIMPDGRWWYIEPDQNCYKALEAVLNDTYDSKGALYFESCQGDSWHSKNLEYLYQSGSLRFYK